MLVFVGLKMVWLDGAFGGKVPIVWSLAVIAVALAASVVASLVFPPPPAAAGTVPPSKESATW